MANEKKKAKVSKSDSTDHVLRMITCPECGEEFMADVDGFYKAKLDEMQEHFIQASFEKKSLEIQNGILDERVAELTDEVAALEQQVADLQAQLGL